MEWTAARIRVFRERGLCLSQHDFARVVGFAMRTVGNAERGAHPPSLSLRRALDRALDNASAAERDRFLVAVDADQDAGTQVISAAPEVESVELLRRTQASDLGPDTLDQLEQLVERLGVDYFAVAPATFRGTVLAWRRYVAGLIDGRVTLQQQRRLYTVAAALSGLVAESSLAIGEDAGAHCATALSLASEIGDGKLAGWVRGTQAQVALYAGDPREAVGFAEAGRAVAPWGSRAMVRACTHEARARARIGDRVGTEAALDAAEQAWDALTQPPARSIFSFGASYLPYCAATAFVWLQMPDRAQGHARQAVQICDVEPEPPVGRAIARIDLAIALAQGTEPEEASALGLEALDICSERVTLPAKRRIEELLAALLPFSEPRAIELRERWQWISG